MSQREDLVVERGADWEKVIQWMTDPIVYKDVTEVISRLPLVLRVMAHGLPPDWLVAVPGLSGGCGCSVPGGDLIYYRVTVIDADTIRIEGVDATMVPDYISLSQIAYKTPMDMPDFSAELVVRENSNDASAQLLVLSTANGKITINNVTRQTRVLMLTAFVAALTFNIGYYKFTIFDADLQGTRILEGSFRVR